MDYYIDIDYLYDKLVFYKERLELMESLIDNIDKLSEKIEWQGETYDSFSSVYSAHVDTCKDTLKGLLYYVKLLFEFYSKYDGFYDEMEKKYMQSLDKIGVYDDEDKM